MADRAFSDPDLDTAAWESLARLPGETLKAHAAFLDYVRMGAGRSLRQLCAHYRRQSGGEVAAEKPPTQRLRTLEDWSVKYAWQDRLKAYQVEQDQRDQAIWAERRAEVLEADYQAGADLRALADQILEQTPQFLKTTRRLVKGTGGQPDREVVTIAISADTMLRVIKLASELQCQAAGVQPPAQRLEHTGKDGGPIQTSGVEVYIPDNGRALVQDDSGDTDTGETGSSP